MMNKISIELEHDAWKDMCNEIQRVFNIDPTDFNLKKYRPLMEKIEKWGYYEHRRRTHDPKNDKKEGTFWDGEGKWVYQAPNTQTHTVEHLEAILQKLKELNEAN